MNYISTRIFCDFFKNINGCVGPVVARSTADLEVRILSWPNVNFSQEMNLRGSTRIRCEFEGGTCARAMYFGGRQTGSEIVSPGDPNTSVLV